MGLTKTEAFTESQNALASYAKALAHPARIAILEHLIQEDKCICGDLVDILPLAQATVSQHLAELKKAGLIKGTISGTSMCYCLDKSAWEKCIGAIESLIEHVKSVTKCC
jgi:DNA-binding transcriptional ArsR family regulator